MPLQYFFKKNYVKFFKNFFSANCSLGLKLFAICTKILVNIVLQTKHFEPGLYYTYIEICEIDLCVNVKQLKKYYPVIN